MLMATAGLATGAAADTTADTKRAEGPEITVGPAGAQVIGRDERAIQIAIDALAQAGGGTVRVLPGTYVLNNSIIMRSKVRLTGDREKTILKRAPVAYSRLAVDADIGQKEITPLKPGLFKPGRGIMLIGANGGGRTWEPLWITGREGDRLLLNDYINVDYNAEQGAAVVSYYGMIRAHREEDFEISGFTIEAGVDKVVWSEAEIRIGGVWLTFCQNATVRSVTVRNMQGDGILSEPGEHVSVEDCESSGNTHHGIHFGSHSPYSRAVNCDLHDNGSDGLYLCWGVRQSLVKGCKIYRNGYRLNRSGISLGHKDTDNVIEDNRVYENAKNGIMFREKTEANGAHRNLVRNNVIENNGRPLPKQTPETRQYPGYCGIYLNGITHDITIENNVIRDTRTSKERTQAFGVYIAKGVSRVTLTSNTMSGHDENVKDESGSKDDRLPRE